MARTLSVFSLAALLALPALQAEARSARPAAKPEASAALRSRAAAMNGFTMRMNRLDALMGRTAAAQ